jgi:uncharacterized membrane protein
MEAFDMIDKENKNGLWVFMNSVLFHPVYIILMLLVFLPMIGAIIERGKIVSGVVLLSTQVWWVIKIVFKVNGN